MLQKLYNNISQCLVLVSFTESQSLMCMHAIHPHVAPAFLIQPSVLSRLSKRRNCILSHIAHGDVQHLYDADARWSYGNNLKGQT